MIQIILLIVGIVYALRKPKLKALTTEQYPDISPEVFAEWKALELKSINLILWAGWGLLVISIAANLLAGILLAATGMANAITSQGFQIGDQVLFFVVFFIVLAIASKAGTKAANIKKQYGIRWPK